MRRKIYTYADLTKLPQSKLFAQIKHYPIITVSTDLRKGLKGRFEFDHVNGIFRKDDQIHVTDFYSLLNTVDKDWGSDQSIFNQMVVISEHLRGKLEAARDDQKQRNWLIGCMRNMKRIQAAIKQLEEALVKPQDLDACGDRNMDLFLGVWEDLQRRDPSIRNYHARMSAMTTRSVWEPILSDALHIADVSSVKTLIFMGFYFITPQQEYVMRLLEQAGFELVYLIPYDERVPFVHEIWDRTYAPEYGFAPKSEWYIEKAAAENPWGDIFEGKDVTLPNRVQIREYATMMEFVDDAKHIRDKGYTLYSSNFQTADQVLKEYFPEEYGERKILSYPIGQFISTLNQMWDDDRHTIILDEDLLVECFSSGWLAKNGISGRQYMQDLTYILPFFTGCATVDEWEDRITLLQQIRKEVVSAFDVEKDPDPAVARWQDATDNPLLNISSFAVPEEKLDVILMLIRQLLQMAKDLFKGNETVMIQDHVRNLDYILRQNEISNEIYTEERELVAEIFETLAKPSDFTAKCYPADISNALSLYINGRLSDGEIQKKTVGMVIPIYFIDAACIKNNSKVHLCLCDVDSMPGGRKEYIWPLSEEIVRKALQKTGNPLIRNLMQIIEVSGITNRYFMYTALRNKDVQISWVSSMNDKLLAPSSYVKLIAEAAGIPMKPAKRNLITFGKVADSAWANETVKPYHYEEMPQATIKEARMDYALCPMKYILSYVVEKYPTYQSEFQQNYVLNAVISAIYSLMQEKGISVDEIYRNLMALFPNLRRIEKRQVYDYIGNDHGEHDMDYGNRTQCGSWFITDERLKIHFPGQYARQRSYDLYGKQNTPDRRDGMNLFDHPGRTDDTEESLQEACAFCPHVNNCRNALFNGDQERLYD